MWRRIAAGAALLACAASAQGGEVAGAGGGKPGEHGERRQRPAGRGEAGRGAQALAGENRQAEAIQPAAKGDALTAEAGGAEREGKRGETGDMWLLVLTLVTGEVEQGGVFPTRGECQRQAILYLSADEGVEKTECRAWGESVPGNVG